MGRQRRREHRGQRHQHQEDGARRGDGIMPEPGPRRPPRRARPSLAPSAAPVQRIASLHADVGPRHVSRAGCAGRPPRSVRSATRLPGEHEHRHQHEGRHEHWVVARGERLDEQPAHAGPGEHGLGDHCPADQAPTLQAEERDERQQGVAQAMAQHHAGLAEPLGARRADIVLPHRLQQHRPQIAAPAGDLERREHGGGTGDVPQPIGHVEVGADRGHAARRAAAAASPRRRAARRCPARTSGPTRRAS